METLQKPSLFWDVRSVDPQKNERFVIGRILSYGDEKDFSWAMNFYGKNKISESIMKIRDLDRKSQSFWLQFFNLKTRCIPKRSAQKPNAFWKR